MTGLADLSIVDSWAAAGRFTWPTVRRYNIAADCLRATSDRVALFGVDGASVHRITFGELDERSARVAAGFASLDVRPGDRVAVRLSQSVEMAVVVLAALRCGAVVVPISTVLGDDGVRHRLADCAPRVLVAAGSHSEATLAAEVGATLVATDDDGPVPRLRDLPGAPDDAASFAPENAASFAPENAAGFAATGPDSPALLLYTSGTTGKPKGVLHGQRVLLGHHGATYALDRIRPGDVAYSPVDWAWAGGLLLGLLVPLAHGIPVVAHRQPRFDPGRTLALMRECGVTVGLFPPTALRILRQSGEAAAAVAAGLRLRCLVTGAEAVEPELFAWAAADLGVRVNNAFGQTEANALVGHSGVLGPLDPACLGRPYPGHRVAVVDDELRPVRPGEAGQLAVRSDDPVCMLGYWNAPAATAEKVRGGWLLTGDTAHADGRGQVYFHGRVDDLIKSGGYRLGPAEVEAAILRHPDVAECAVVGLPDPARGQAVTAFVRLRGTAADGQQLTRQLQTLVRDAVGAHAYPRAVHYVTDLPRTSTGKVNRAALRSVHSGGHR
jgi:acetyl-CoA synthetase